MPKFLYSIRFQIICIAVIAMLALSSVTTWIAIKNYREDILKERKQYALILLRSFTNLAREQMILQGTQTTGAENDSTLTLDLAVFDFMTDALKNDSSLMELYIQDSIGRITIHSTTEKMLPDSAIHADTTFQRIIKDTIPGMYFSYSAEGELAHYYAPVMDGNKKLGIARVTFNSKAIDRSIRSAVERIVTAFIAILIFVLALLLLTLTYMLSPIKKIAQKMSSVQIHMDNPASAEVSIDFASRSELGKISTAFNLMMRNIRKAIEDRFLLEAEKKKLERIAALDPLTGLLNKGQFQHDLAEAVTEAKTDSKNLSIIMCDMDYFKDLNDSIGHAAGDEALKHFASAAKSSTRSNDKIYRVGGDEFVIILQGANIEIANNKTAKISAAYEARIKDQTGNKTTISFGVVEYNGTDNADDFFQRADAEMYRIKRAKKTSR